MFIASKLTILNFNKLTNVVHINLSILKQGMNVFFLSELN